MTSMLLFLITFTLRPFRKQGPLSRVLGVSHIALSAQELKIGQTLHLVSKEPTFFDVDSPVSTLLPKERAFKTLLFRGE